MQIKVVPLGAGQVSHKLSRHDSNSAVHCGAAPEQVCRPLVQCCAKAESEAREEEVGERQEGGREEEREVKDGRLGGNLEPRE